MAQMTTALEPGAQAPFFSASDEQGHIHRLTGYAGTNLVLCFFRPDLAQSDVHPRDFAEAYPGLRKKDIFLLGVHHGSVQAAGELSRHRSVPFPIIADPEGRIFQAYGISEKNGPLSLVAIAADGRVKLVLKHRSRPQHVIDLLGRL